ALELDELAVELEGREAAASLELAEQVLEPGSSPPPLTKLRGGRLVGLLGVDEHLRELGEGLVVELVLVGAVGFGERRLGRQVQIALGLLELRSQARELGLELLDRPGLEPLELAAHALELPAERLLAGEQLVEPRTGGRRLAGLGALGRLGQLILEVGD